MQIPIFVITYERLTCLRTTLNSFSRISTLHCVVICDNCSTYPPTIQYLNELESQGITVYRSPEHQFDLIRYINSCVDDWYADHDAPYYVVTDPDIELLGPPNLLDAYTHILEEKSFECVGPELLIDDIPLNYPLRDFVQQDHGWAFWSQDPVPTLSFQGQEIRYTDRLPNGKHIAIDTTFGVYRKGFPMSRNKVSARCYPPYAARHLDWYVDMGNLPSDFCYYLHHARGSGRYSLTELLKIWPKLI